MIVVSRKEHCCGCAACANICPVDCIVMEEDFEGFKYPVVDIKKCINCHKCEEVCPVINVQPYNKSPDAFLVRAEDEKLLEACTSGGVFSELAVETIKRGGIVYGAVFDNDFVVRHKRITNLEETKYLPGSKYVQSDIENIYKKIREDVISKRRVIFCGTPCQVEGLKRFLNKNYDNLLLVDFVCHGVPSPKLWRYYVEYIEKKNGKLKSVNFRSKSLGYHVSVMEEQFEDGKKQIGSARTNLMTKCYFKNVADRPICYECPFKTVSRGSDVTIFDGWSASKYKKDLIDDDKGYTITLIHSDNGKKNMAIGKWNRFETIDLNLAIALDGKMATTSIKKPEERSCFYKTLEQEGISKTVRKLFPISRTDYFIEKTKIFLNRIGLLSKLKEVVDNFF